MNRLKYKYKTAVNPPAPPTTYEYTVLKISVEKMLTREDQNLSDTPRVLPLLPSAVGIPPQIHLFYSFMFISLQLPCIKGMVLNSSFGDACVSVITELATHLS